MNCSEDNFLPNMPGGVYFHLVHGTIDVVILVGILSCNSVVALAIVKYNRRRKTKGVASPPNSASTRLVLGLAISDILAGLTTVYYLAFDYSCAVYATLGPQKIPCVARFAIFVLASATSSFLLIALSIDRYVAIVHPLRHRDIMTKRVANLLIILTWTWGSATGLCLLFWNNWTPNTPCQEFHIVPIYFITTVCTTNLVIVATILLVLHCSIHREAVASSELVRTMSIRNLESPESSMRAKSARNIYLVLACVIALWIPLTAIVIARGYGLESPYLEIAYRLSISFYSLGYFINIFIYSWKNTTIRAVVLQMFEQLDRRRESDNSCRRIVGSCDETSPAECKSIEV